MKDDARDRVRTKQLEKAGAHGRIGLESPGEGRHEEHGESTPGPARREHNAAPSRPRLCDRQVTVIARGLMDCGGTARLAPRLRLPPFVTQRPVRWRLETLAKALSVRCCGSVFIFFFSSRRRHTRCLSDWSSDVCSSDLMGVRHGLYCLGCCWALMTLLSVGGAMNLPWIAALASLVAIEKLAPRGQLIAQLLGEIGRASCRERVEVWVGGGSSIGRHVVVE